MRAFLGWLRPGQYRRDETDPLQHRMRTNTQIAMLQTDLRRRQPPDRPSIADALRPPAHHDKEPS